MDELLTLSVMQKLMITLLALFCLSNLYGQESVSVIFEDDLINRSATDAGAALQGKVAGLYVMNMSGAPGETARLRLRGFTTHTGNGGPLLIVDGLKVENIQHLDPSMIEKVEVLKDTASRPVTESSASLQGKARARSAWPMISSLPAPSQA